MLKADQVLQDRYRIIGVLGQGGMGSVFQAMDLSLDLPCVVKELLAPNDASLLADVAAQFRREAKTLASLRHPNLPRVSNYFTEQNSYYLVMDLIEGKSLDKMIGPDGLPEPLVLNYADQLLGVLEYIHGQGVLHRDIKPANIIVQPDGRIVLVDFGLVKVISGNQHTMVSVRGLSPKYAPPEQYTGGTDQRSDLYSLAATLYHALTGQSPTSAMDQMAGEKLLGLRQLRTAISPNTERVILKMLSLDRNARYQTAAAMRADLLGAATVPLPQQLPLQRATPVHTPARESRAAGRGTRLPLVLLGITAFLLIGLGAIILPSALTPSTPALSPSATRIATAEITAQATAQLAAAVSTPVPKELTPTPSTEPATNTPVAAANALVPASPTAVPIPATNTIIPASPTAVPIPATNTIISASPTAVPIPATSTPIPQASPLVLTLAPGVTMTLVSVPAGEFLMGSDPTKDPDALPEEQPQHTVYLSAFYIGRSEVTNAQFAAFAKATNRQWSMLPGKENYPVGEMGWFDAKAFADWLALKTGKTVRLPTEAEWEKACRGTDARIYPWGDQWDASRLNSGEGGANDTTPVDKYSPAGDSPYGAENMGGNVWEWISDWYTDTAYLSLAATGTPVKDPTGPASGTVHSKRSGSFGNTRIYERCAYRNRNHPFSGPKSNGFRVVVSPS